MKLMVQANVHLADGLSEESADRYLAEIGSEFDDKLKELLASFDVLDKVTISDTDSPIVKIVETEDEDVGLIVRQNASYYQVTGEGE